MEAIPSRPYSKVKGSEPSVTTILGVKNTPGLDWAAAKLTAEYAVLEDTWRDTQAGDTAIEIDNLRRYFRGIWDGRAYMGTLVHKVMEGWAHDKPVNLEALTREHRPWDRPEVYPTKVHEVQEYVQGLMCWWEDHKPTEISTEECIRTGGQYVGTRDMVCTINGQRWLLDLKTTDHKWDPKQPPHKQKGVYTDSWALQLAAYRYATEVVTYKWVDGPKKPELILGGGRLNEPVDRCGVIHLRGDSRYTFYEIPVDIDTYDVFLSLIPIYHWLKKPPAPIIIEQGGRNE